ncbi:dihydrofolate reductase family protein [Paenibacillus sp. AR247]|uniref:dihydrofolate reductase family protein n=1 Tax=Paenibacillus sp. AR247 TaxID=1631599 RepID=UPI002157A182|nr:hypothetical protein [Paenibacillus sp. AR247]
MAKIVFALNQSLDGFVDHDHPAFQPDPVLFRHFIDDVRGLAGCLYGRRMYETMRYWDEDHLEWDAPEREYAAAWQSKPKWVVSRTLKSVGPNASLIEGDLAAAIRGLKAQHEGLRRSTAAAAPRGKRSNWREGDQVDLRSSLVVRLTQRPKGHVTLIGILRL